MADEITLESVLETPIDQLNDDQKTFLKTNQDKLNDDQKKTYSSFFGDNSGDDNKGEDDDFDFEDDGQSPPDLENPEDKKNKKNKEGDEDEDEDEDLDPSDKDKIAKTAEEVAKKTLAPILEAQEKTRVDTEWKKTLSDYPELKKLETKILRYANHPMYKGKPIMQSVMDVAGVDVFLKIGAKRARVAGDEANKTNNNGGGGSRKENVDDKTGVNNSGIPSFVGKSSAEINKIIAGMRASGTYRER